MRIRYGRHYLFALVVVGALGLQNAFGNLAYALAKDKVEDKADVIVIQSEAFMDVSKIQEFHLSKDVTENFRKFSAKGLSGELAVPVNGGLTCNSEYEMLTGMRQPLVSYLPYVDDIFKNKKVTSSLAWDFRHQGYQTVAIHPYLKDFFNRNAVYPLLGMEKFISMDQFVSQKKIGYYISDETDYKMVEYVADHSSKPVFIFNVTIQNHAPFTYKAANDVVDLGYKGKISKEDKASLTNYVSGLKLSDEALVPFMRWVENRKRHTIVVFYGDHQPSKSHKVLGQLSNFKAKNGQFRTDYFVYDNKGHLKPEVKNHTAVGLSRTIKVLAKLPLTDFDTYVLKNQDQWETYYGLKDSAAYKKANTAMRDYIVANPTLYSMRRPIP